MLGINVKKHESLIGALGNILEWYDYALIMPLTVVLMTQIFPSYSPFWVKILGGLMVSMGLFTRPLGAFIFGPIGDKLGRQKALSISILMMAIPTFLMGILPGYDSIGALSPILFIIFRILQGISMGGEYTAAMVHIVEKAPTNRRGFYGSWTDAGNQLGVLLAGQAIVWLHSFFSEGEIYSFAWRIPFLCGILLVPFAFMIPNQLPPKKKESQHSVFKNLMEHKKEVACVIAITSFSAVSFYTLWTFLPYYLVSSKLLSLKEAATCSAGASLISILSVLLGGYVSDIIRRKPCLISGIIGVLCVVSWMFIWGVSSFTEWFCLQLAYGFFLGVYFSSRSAFFAEAFPVHVRCTAVSVSLSLAQATFGGSTPVIMPQLVSISPILVIAPILLVSCCAIFAISLLKDRTGEPFI